MYCRNLKTLTYTFLQSLSQIFDEILRSRQNLKLNPLLVFICGLTITSILAFSQNIIGLLFSIPLLILLNSLLRISFRKILKPLCVISIFVFVISLPILTQHALGTTFLEAYVKKHYLIDINLYVFILRVTLSTYSIVLVMSYLGFHGLIDVLLQLKLSLEVLLAILLTIRFIPIQAIETLKMLSAREARIVKKNSIKEMWIVLATTIGDLMIKSMYEAEVLKKSIQARMFMKTFKTYEAKNTRLVLTTFQFLH